MIAGVVWPASAHRRDEYLQAVRLAIEPDRVRVGLDLTPGIAVAPSVLAEVDRDLDGTISADESRAYAGAVLSAISLAVDGTTLRAAVVDVSVAAPEAMLRGEGTMRLNAVATIPHTGRGVHRLRVRNGHRPDIGVYLANALVPASDRVTVTAQLRDYEQRELTVEYALRADTTDAPAAIMATAVAGAFLWLARASWRGRRRRLEGVR